MVLWLQKHRSVRFTPKISSPTLLAESWWAWWRANQPKWRTQSPDGVLQTSGGDVSNVRIGGQTGIFEFVMVLAWWGALIPHPSETVDALQWRDAVVDVTYILSI